MKTPYLSVIIPAYNETATLGGTINQVTQFLRTKNYSWEIIIVDDGSTDDTASIADRLISDDIRLIRHAENKGKGAAVQTGMLAAQGEFRIFFDADNQISFTYIDVAIPLLEAGADIAISAAHVPFSSAYLFRYRYYFGRLSKWFIRTFMGWKLKDTQRGFKAFNKKAAEIIFNRLTISRWGFDIEVMAIAQQYKLSVAEFLVEYGMSSSTHVSPWAYVATLGDLFKIKWYVLTGRYMKPESIIGNPQCHICRSYTTALFTRKNGYDVFKCETCGFMFVWPAPVSPDTIYSHEYFQGAHSGFGYVNYQEDKAGMRSTFERFLAELNKAAPHKGILLDVGAATGFFMTIARKDGWHVQGVEISPWASQTGREAGLNIVTGRIQDAHFQPQMFDVVTFWDVFEHVSNPRAELNIVRSILKPSGILAMNMPDAGSFFARLMGSRWHSFVPPEHLNYFNPHNLRQILEEEGFEIVSIDIIEKRFTVQYIFQMLARWQNLGVWRWCATKAKHAFWGKWNIALNLRDNMFVVARKKTV